MPFDFDAHCLRQGMFFREAEGISCRLPGSSVSLCFEGRAITALLKDLDGSGTNWVNVFLDDLPQKAFRVQPGVEEYLLFDDLPEGMHRLTLQKRTEAGFGTLLLRGFTGQGLRIAPPPEPLPYRLLLIGDSITCGFGNEAEIPPDVDASRENFARTYGAIAARELRAEVLACAASGTGVYQNFGGVREGRMSDYFMDSFCADLDTRCLDPFEPDAVVVNLGTNDWSAPIVPADYTAQYEVLLDFLRRRWSTVPVVCAIGPMNLCPAAHIGAMVEQRRASGDRNLYALVFPEIRRACDGFGGAGHPSLKKHREMAGLLSDFLRTLFPFDR